MTEAEPAGLAEVEDEGEGANATGLSERRWRSSSGSELASTNGSGSGGDAAACRAPSTARAVEIATRSIAKTDNRQPRCTSLAASPTKRGCLPFVHQSRQTPSPALFFLPSAAISLVQPTTQRTWSLVNDTYLKLLLDLDYGWLLCTSAACLTRGTCGTPERV